MELPNVAIKIEDVVSEYAGRLANLTAANIRLSLMVHEVIAQRDDALNRWRNAEQRYVDLESEIASRQKVMP